MLLLAIKYIKSPLFTMSFLWDTYQLTRMTSENHVITLPPSKREEIHFLAKFGNHTFLSMKRVSNFESSRQIMYYFFFKFNNEDIKMNSMDILTLNKFQILVHDWCCYGFDFDQISMLLSRPNCWPLRRHWLVQNQQWKHQKYIQTQ